MREEWHAELAIRFFDVELPAAGESLVAPVEESALREGRRRRPRLFLAVFGAERKTDRAARQIEQETKIARHRS